MINLNLQSHRSAHFLLCPHGCPWRTAGTCPLTFPVPPYAATSPPGRDRRPGGGRRTCRVSQDSAGARGAGEDDRSVGRNSTRAWRLEAEGPRLSQKVKEVLALSGHHAVAVLVTLPCDPGTATILRASVAISVQN